MLRDHAGLHHQHEKENQKGVLLVIVRKVQQQQRRYMAHTVNADHDAPLQLGIALQKALRVIRQGTHHRDRQKHVDRNEHREQVEQFVADQSVLNRQHDKKSQHQTAVITAARRRERHELTQCKSGHQSE